LLKLKGDVDDLEELPYWFPSGDPFSFQEGQSFYLASPRLDVLPDSRSVQDVGGSILEEVAAVVSLIWPSFEAPTIDHLVHESSDGNRSLHYTLKIASATHRMKTRDSTGAPLKAGRTDAQWYHMISQAGPHLQTALLLWADPARTWPRLYRVLEELEHHISQEPQKLTLCTAAERKRFTHSANAAAVAGKDARHRNGMFDAPKDPMTLQEATKFIRRVIHDYLKSEAMRQRLAEEL
jgi:hypothetical protein